MITLPNEIYSAILGALLGAWLTYYFARQLAADQLNHMLVISKGEAERAAGIRFRHAFAKELGTLESGLILGVDLQDYLRIAFEARHAEANVEFEPFVPRKRLVGYRADWERYCYGERQNGVPFTTELMTADSLLFLEYNAESHLANPDLPRKFAIERIRKLLTYAQET